METLDGSIIVTALPSIARSFGETTLALSVAITAYLIAVAVFVPMAGWASERFGARNVFATAVGVFTLASLLCGLSPNFWTFIASRILQGHGGGLHVAGGAAGRAARGRPSTG